MDQHPDPNPESTPPPPADTGDRPAPGMIPDDIDAQQCQAILRQARQRRRKIDRAVTVASFNGWTLAVLAGLSLPFAPFSVTTAVAVVVLAAAAFVEFRGRGLMRKLDDRAPVVLATNQAALGVIVMAYAAWRLWQIRNGLDPALAQMRQMDASVQGIGDLAQSLAELLYTTLIGGVVLLQGAMVWFYLSRRRFLRLFREQTPDWVIELLRAAA